VTLPLFPGMLTRPDMLRPRPRPNYTDASDPDTSDSRHLVPGAKMSMGLVGTSAEKKAKAWYLI